MLKLMLVKLGLWREKKLNKLAKEINDLLLNNETVKEYLSLKEDINRDEALLSLKIRLDEIRKVVCKNKDMDSSEYFELLDKYNNDYRIKRFNELKKEINDYLIEISDILSLK